MMFPRHLLLAPRGAGRRITQPHRRGGLGRTGGVNFENRGMCGREGALHLIASFRGSKRFLGRVLLATGASIVWLGLGACVTKSQAKAQARAAYLAGQQEAVARMQQNQVRAQGATVQINGPVRNPVVPWTQGMTLMKAIVAAEYGGATDPAEILILRHGVATRVEVQKLLGGQDIPVLPDDVVQLVLPQAGAAKVQP
jgi:hypothetical protein